MTPLTASGWLWAGWCVFAMMAAIASIAPVMDGKESPDLAHNWFVALLSCAWLAWLVSP